MKEISVYDTLNLKFNKGGSIDKLLKKFNKKEIAAILYLVIALVAFFTWRHCLIGTIIPGITLTCALFCINWISLVIKENFTNKPLFAFLVTSIILTLAVGTAQATLPDNLLPKQSLTIEKSLHEYFKNYAPQNYEFNPEVSILACKMSNRFSYIETSVITINQTDINSELRIKNLISRRKKALNNTQKVNKREKNADRKLLVINMPEIIIQKVDLLAPYEQIDILGKAVEKNIRLPECNPNCAINHIDYNSFEIVKIIDNIKSSQDEINLKLTNWELLLDEIEAKIRDEENLLTKLGY